MRPAFALLLAAASVLPLAAQTPRPAPEFAIHMLDGSEKLLSSYKGKDVVCLAFFFTTCPHCQDMARLLQQIQAEYGPKGVQVLASAFDDNARAGVRDFIGTYTHNAYPMGWDDRGAVLEFLQQSIMAPLYVPVLVFIDRNGVIQSQFIGDPTFLKDPPKNVRAELDKALAVKIAPAKKTATTRTISKNITKH